MTVIKAAAVQLSPVLCSREGTVDKACRQILARLVRYSEVEATRTTRQHGAEV
jgi:hypothetical protein